MEGRLEWTVGEMAPFSGRAVAMRARTAVLRRRRSRRGQRRIAYIHNLARNGKDHTQVAACDRIDSLRITKRSAFQLKLAGGLRQLLFFLLRFLDAIAILDPLVVLPRIREETKQKHPSQHRHDKVIAAALIIGFANNVAVDDALFKTDLNGHQFFSHARNFALRARGLLRTSSSVAVTTFFVRMRPESVDARNFCFTIRSSSEWNEITTTRPPLRTTVIEEFRKLSRLPNSSLR